MLSVAAAARTGNTVDEPTGLIDPPPPYQNTTQYIYTRYNLVITPVNLRAVCAASKSVMSPEGRHQDLLQETAPTYTNNVRYLIGR